MRGRPRKPTALKIHEGTYRADRHATEMVLPPPNEIVPPPKELTTFSKKIWKEWFERLSRTGVLSENDLRALKQMCETELVFELAQSVIRKEGLTFLEPVYAKGEHVGDVVRERPEVSIAADASRRLVGLYDKLGMTPQGRTRVAKTDKSDGGSSSLSSGARRRG